jgi:predicted fused transcriptional regulator/phosphomethylpyrimidine kinase
MTITKFGQEIELENTEFYVGKCGSGHAVFGERAHFTKATAKHLVFTTESGAIVKTDYTLNTIGKARRAHYWVGIGDRTNEENYIHQSVSYWNAEKCCFEKK